VVVLLSGLLSVLVRLLVRLVPAPSIPQPLLPSSFLFRKFLPPG
jgi:hypothetical protein